MMVTPFITVGSKRAMDILLGGKDISGIEATETGLITEVDPGKEYYCKFQG